MAAASLPVSSAHDGSSHAKGSLSRATHSPCVNGPNSVCQCRFADSRPHTSRPSWSVRRRRPSGDKACPRPGPSLPNHSRTMWFRVLALAWKRHTAATAAAAACEARSSLRDWVSPSGRESTAGMSWWVVQRGTYSWSKLALRPADPVVRHLDSAKTETLGRSQRTPRSWIHLESPTVQTVGFYQRWQCATTQLYPQGAQCWSQPICSRAASPFPHLERMFCRSILDLRLWPDDGGAPHDACCEQAPSRTTRSICVPSRVVLPAQPEISMIQHNHRNADSVDASLVNGMYHTGKLSRGPSAEKSGGDDSVGN